MRRAGDEGSPIALGEGALAEGYRRLARALAEALAPFGVALPQAVAVAVAVGGPIGNVDPK